MPIDVTRMPRVDSTANRLAENLELIPDQHGRIILANRLERCIYLIGIVLNGHFIYDSMTKYMTDLTSDKSITAPLYMLANLGLFIAKMAIDNFVQSAETLQSIKEIEDFFSNHAVEDFKTTFKIKKDFINSARAEHPEWKDASDEATFRTILNSHKECRAIFASIITPSEINRTHPADFRENLKTIAKIIFQDIPQLSKESQDLDQNLDQKLPQPQTLREMNQINNIHRKKRQNYKQEICRQENDVYQKIQNLFPGSCEKFGLRLHRPQFVSH